jgi:hypothetical protein
MTLVEIIKGLGLPFAYDHFAEGEAPDPPYLLYRYPESQNFSADNIVWNKADTVYLELYSDYKDMETEHKIEEALLQQEVYWDKSETWIDSEKLYEVLYSFGWEEE